MECIQFSDTNGETVCAEVTKTKNARAFWEGNKRGKSARNAAAQPHHL